MENSNINTNIYNQPPVIQDIPQGTSPRLSKIYQYTRSPIVWLIAGAIVITALVAVLVLSVGKSTSYNPSGQLQIDNLSALIPGMPDSYRENIQNELYLQATSDLIGSNKTTPTSGAVIRDGSLNHIDVSDELHIGDFIVDIPSIEFSYIISYRYGRLEGFQIELFASAKVYCIEDESQRIYPNFDADYCFAETGFRRSDAITYLTPYTAEDGSYTISWVYDAASPSKYSLIVHYEPTDDDASPAKLAAFEQKVDESIKTWLSGQGLNPDNYNLHHESEGEAL